jgi:hypothetical protein
MLASVMGCWQHQSRARDRKMAIAAEVIKRYKKTPLGNCANSSQRPNAAVIRLAEKLTPKGIRHKTISDARMRETSPAYS